MNSSSVPNFQGQVPLNQPLDVVHVLQRQEPEQVEPLNLALRDQPEEPKIFDQWWQFLLALPYYRLASQFMLHRPMVPGGFLNLWPGNGFGPINRPDEPVPQPIPQVHGPVAANPPSPKNCFPVDNYMVQRKSPDSFILFIVNNPENKAQAICERCGKVFFNTGSIYRHQKIHTGEKHACPLCPSKHTQKYNLRLHVETHIGTDFDPSLLAGMSAELRGVLLGNSEYIRPEKYLKRMEMALRKRETANKRTKANEMEYWEQGLGESGQKY